MKQEYKDWFLENIKDKEFKKIKSFSKSYGRQYEYYNLGKHIVPFDFEFKKYLESFVNDNNFDYDCYHIHRWSEGCYFDEHIDDRENRKFSYVCELQQSECKTKLLVENKPIDEGWFDVQTLHMVPKIKKGERISLTVFGKNKIKKRLI